MSVTIGAQLGSYEVTALLGKGGMGEVYRARDTKLKRDVAIKILPDEFARDADRIARFQREAEVLASLSHQNIARIYDLQQSGEIQFLVMELVEGETLADLIKRGPLPIEEALQIGKSICEALEAAHEKGIVHSDLKPANVKITSDGKSHIRHKTRPLRSPLRHRCRWDGRSIQSPRYPPESHGCNQSSSFPFF
jgi:serine/threonine-protein kinase